jgi:type VI secretion system protein ImpC
MPVTKKEWESDVRFSVDPGSAEQIAAEDSGAERKLVIGVLADFGGLPGGLVPLHKRRFIEIDRDTFDGVMARFQVRWQGMVSGSLGREASETIELGFHDLEDFHPDRFVRQIPALRALHDLLSDLNDPARCEEAADTLERESGAHRSQEPENLPAPSASSKTPDTGGLLDSILERQSAPTARMSEVDRLVHDLVSPHSVRVDASRQERLVASVGKRLSHQVSAILHDPLFQGLEALWRGLRYLVDSAGPDTRIRMVQVGKEEILQDIMSGRSLESCELARLLLDPASVPGSERCSLWVGGYEFSHDLEDLAVLERLGNLCAVLKAPLVSAASPRLFGCDAYGDLPPCRELDELLEDTGYDAWRTLRMGRVAQWLALAAPRMLCRLPYGKEQQPAETFPLEEEMDGDSSRHLLWGNPAFAVAAVFARAFEDQGWEMDPSASVPRLEGLPLYVHKVEGEIVSEPCAEMYIGERMLETFMDTGLIPLVSHRDADIVSLPSMTTLAIPRTPLRLRGAAARESRG